jgi:ATP-dependent exoDNAse (exonuclease V) beta subunit
VNGVVDEDSASRRAIRTELDRTHFVEAGAGTGKTTELVGRIISLISSGRARIDEIAAITFTEAAAAELGDRIAAALEVLVGATTTDAGVRARAEAALEELDGAAIGTLHSFARRLLADHPFEAGLPPVFEVLDEIRSGVAFEERWSEFVDALFGSEAHGTSVARAVVCGVRIEHMRSIADAFNRNWDQVADHSPATGAPPPVDASAVLAALDAAARFVPFCTTPDDRLLALLGEVATWAEELRDATDQLSLLNALVDSPAIRPGGTGRQGNWDGKIADVRDRLTEVEHERRSAVERVLHDALAHLAAGVGELTLGAADHRRSEGRLEFHDLLVQARDLLRRRPDVAKEAGERYRFVLIDEFQDTDPIQAELAVRIACDDPSSTVADWTELTVAPGRLFFVGDPKQSIYRFRRADLNQFMGVRDRFGDSVAQLTRNHRSVPGIIAWTNSVIGSILGGDGRESQPRYEPLEPVRVPHEARRSEPPVVLLGGSRTDGARARDVRATEADDIVRAIRHALDERWPVGVEGRPAKPSDVTILVPGRTGLPILLQALDDGAIPYRLEATSLVYSAGEVGDLMNVLRAVDNPANDVAVVAALRSTAFGCGDDDLLEFRLRGGRWDYRTAARQPDLGPANPVTTGLAALRDLHDGRWWCDVGELVGRVVNDRRLLALALDTARPREAWRRLRFVADEARRFADAFGGDLRRYLSWTERQCDENARAAEVVLPEPDDEAVRIMTIHAAKGLEFPIVVLAGLGTGRSTSRGPVVIWGDSGPELKVTAGVATPGYEESARRESEMDRSERHRLLYVAATRARDHLIVSLHHAAGTDCLAATVEAACDLDPQAWRRLPELGVVGPPPAPAASRSGGDGGVEEDRATWVARRRQVIDASARLRVVAATGVARLAGEEAAAERAEGPTVPGASAPERSPEPAPDAEAEGGTGPGSGTSGDPRAPWRRGRAGTAVGRAVHATLQRVDLVTGEGLEEIAALEAAVEGIADRSSEVARKARAAVDSDVVRAAVAGGRHWRELYVGVPVGDRVLEGFVDLLVEAEDRLAVVDYKTDQVGPGDDLDDLVARYRLQGAAYALAVETVVGRQVDRMTFLFLGADRAIPREIDDLSSAKLEVRRILSTARA